MTARKLADMITRVLADQESGLRPIGVSLHPYECRLVITALRAERTVDRRGEPWQCEAVRRIVNAWDAGQTFEECVRLLESYHSAPKPRQSSTGGHRK